MKVTGTVMYVAVGGNRTKQIITRRNAYIRSILCIAVVPKPSTPAPPYKKCEGRGQKEGGVRSRLA